MRRREFNSRLLLSAVVFFAGLAAFGSTATDTSSIGLLTVVARLLLLATSIVSFLILYPACVKRVHDVGISSMVLLPIAALGASLVVAATRGFVGIGVFSAMVLTGFILVLAICPSGPDNIYGPRPFERRSPLRPRQKSGTLWRYWLARQHDRGKDFLVAVLLEYGLKGRNKNEPRR